MLTYIQYISNLISKHLVTVAEVAMWAFVAVGICRVAVNGVNGISSFLLGCSIILVAISALFSLIAFSCKLIESKPKTKEREHATYRARED